MHPQCTTLNEKSYNRDNYYNHISRHLATIEKPNLTRSNTPNFHTSIHNRHQTAIQLMVRLHPIPSIHHRPFSAIQIHSSDKTKQVVHTKKTINKDTVNTTRHLPNDKQ